MFSHDLTPGEIDALDTLYTFDSSSTAAVQPGLSGTIASSSSPHRNHDNDLLGLELGDLDAELADYIVNLDTSEKEAHFTLAIECINETPQADMPEKSLIALALLSHYENKHILLPIVRALLEEHQSIKATALALDINPSPLSQWLKQSKIKSLSSEHKLKILQYLEQQPENSKWKIAGSSFKKLIEQLKSSQPLSTRSISIQAASYLLHDRERKIILPLIEFLLKNDHLDTIKLSEKISGRTSLLSKWRHLSFNSPQAVNLTPAHKRALLAHIESCSQYPLWLKDSNFVLYIENLKKIIDSDVTKKVRSSLATGNAGVLEPTAATPSTSTPPTDSIEMISLDEFIEKYNIDPEGKSTTRIALEFRSQLAYFERNLILLPIIHLLHTETKSSIRALSSAIGFTAEMIHTWKNDSSRVTWNDGDKKKLVSYINKKSKDQAWNTPGSIQHKLLNMLTILSAIDTRQESRFAAMYFLTLKEQDIILPLLNLLAKKLGLSQAKIAEKMTGSAANLSRWKAVTYKDKSPRNLSPENKNKILKFIEEHPQYPEWLQDTQFIELLTCLRTIVNNDIAKMASELVMGKRPNKKRKHADGEPESNSKRQKTEEVNSSIDSNLNSEEPPMLPATRDDSLISFYQGFGIFDRSVVSDNQTTTFREVPTVTQLSKI